MLAEKKVRIPVAGTRSKAPRNDYGPGKDNAADQRKPRPTQDIVSLNMNPRVAELLHIPEAIQALNS